MKKKIYIIIASVIGAFLLFNIIIGIVNFENPRPVSFFGLKISFTSTEDMAPHIKDRAFVITRECTYDEIRVDDIIDYRLADMGYSELTRVRQITENGLVTRGDSADTTNNFFLTESEVLGRVVFKTNISANFVNEIGTVGGIFKWIVLPVGIIVLIIFLRKYIKKRISENRVIFSDDDDGNYNDKPNDSMLSRYQQQQNISGGAHGNYQNQSASDNIPPAATNLNSYTFEERPVYSSINEARLYTAQNLENKYASGSTYERPARNESDDYESEMSRSRYTGRYGYDVDSPVNDYSEGRSVRSRFESARMRQRDEGVYEAYNEGRTVRSRSSQSGYGSNYASDNYTSDVQRPLHGYDYGPEEDESSYSSRPYNRLKNMRRGHGYDSIYNRDEVFSSDNVYNERENKYDDRDEDNYERRYAKVMASINTNESHGEEAAAEDKATEKETSGDVSQPKSNTSALSVKLDDSIPEIPNVKKPEYSIVIDFVSSDSEDGTPSIRVRMLDGDKNTVAMTAFNGDPNADKLSGKTELNMRLITPTSFDANDSYNMPLGQNLNLLPGENGLVPTEGLKGLRLSMGSVIFDLEYSSKEPDNTIDFDDYLYSYPADTPEKKD